MRSGIARKLLAAALILALLLGLGIPTGATSPEVVYPTLTPTDPVLTESEQAAGLPEESLYADTDMVRVSIVLDKQPIVEAGFSTQGIAQNPAAQIYRQTLQAQQVAVTTAIAQTVLDGQELDVVWNLTLAANLISANVPYGKLADIRQVPGVEDVVLETQYSPQVVSTGGEYSPNMAVSTQMSGTDTVWDLGYTGAGSRIAVIDTGLDTDHQSVDAGAFDYAIAQAAEQAGMPVAAYIQEKDLLDAAEIASVLGQLNAHRRMPEATAEDFYVNTKLPFGYNYIDNTLNITHDLDAQGGHGSHVAGIAAANRYLPDGEGGYVDAQSAVQMVGNAPDAQLLVMKVFGAYGGAYDSDYFAAVEDAIILGCDSVNLSLGSAYAGLATSEVYRELLDGLAKTDTVLTTSAGNTGNWAEPTSTSARHLYAEDVNLSTAGSPATYTNAFAVASVDNDGSIGSYLQLGEKKMVYMDNYRYAFSALDTNGSGTEYPYLLIDGLGKEEDYAGMDLTGKIVFCSRGETDFSDKATVAANLGAAALVVYNNVPGVFGMDLTGYRQQMPCASISQAGGAAVKAAGTPAQTAEGLTYYTGAITVCQDSTAEYLNSDYLTMSSFSSWGIPGDLSLKPEITAPGGNIYSISGGQWEGAATDEYTFMSGTSMAAPQVAGMTALVMQYIQENHLAQDGLTNRALSQSLLMSTAEPLLEAESGSYYAVMRQGAGLAAVDKAVTSPSYLLVDGQSDGKVKAELKDDPARTGEYRFAFTIHDLSGQDTPYTLSADLFTQGVFEDYVDRAQSQLGLYMDTLTEPLDAQVSFQAQGQAVEPVENLGSYDFTGDGVVDNADAQLLMDHVVLGAALSANEGHADLSGDGTVNTYDVHCLLRAINAGVITVPAGGSVTVEVTITLTESQKATLDENFANGAYIEGFVFAAPAPTAEGLILPTHSIPVLGFYGNWSDPSMLDIGSNQTFTTGEETRQFYVAGFANSLLVRRKTDWKNQYYFGGNPQIADEVYMPERNAMNNVRGDKLDTWAVTPIRNAGNSRLTITNTGTGEILRQEELGSVLAAFYSDFYGWQNNAVQLPVNYTAEGLPEGTQLELALELAPELYVQDGVTGWDALGHGTTWTVPLVIDNTAPELLEVSYNLLSNTMSVTARDNQYIAAVKLLSEGGFNTLAATGANQETAGETATFTLDLEEVEGNRFLLQVYDYANNITAYEVDLTIGTPPERMEAFAFELYTNQFVSFNISGDGFTPADTMTGIMQTGETFYAAADINGLMYAATDTGHLYVINEDHPTEMAYIGAMGVQMTDLAYNRADGKLYGITNTGEVYEIDVMTAQVQFLDQVEAETNTLACDDQGNFYCIIRGLPTGSSYAPGSICRFTLENIAQPEVLFSRWSINGVNGEVQALDWDPNTGRLFWAYFYHWFSHGGSYEHMYNDIYSFDLETGDYLYYAITKNITLETWYERHLSCLILPEKGVNPQWPAETDTVSGVQLDSTALTLVKGEEASLQAAVQPWTVGNRAVTWTTSNSQVATVDGQGLVTGLANGTAVITATSQLDPTQSASCTVTVENPGVQLEGIVKDENGQTRFFTWDMAHGDSWAAGATLPQAVGSAVLEPNSGRLFISDAVRNDHREFATHEIDQATGEILASATSGIGFPIWDMTDCSFLGTAEEPLVIGIYDAYLLAPMDPLQPVFLTVTPELGRSGASRMVAIASGGVGRYDHSSYGWVNTQLLYVLDDAGCIWRVHMFNDPRAGMTALFETVRYKETDLPGLTFQVQDEQMNCSMWADPDTGNLYLAYYTGTTTQIWRLMYNAMTGRYDSTLLGDMGPGVGPVSLYGGQDSSATGEAETVVGYGEAVPFTAPAEAGQTGGSLRTAQPAADAGEPTPEDPDKVTVNLTANEGQTNGLVEVSYDSAVLSLEEVTGEAEIVTIQEESGKVRLGYAWTEAKPSGTAYGQLTFRTLGGCTAEVTVAVLEQNASGISEESKLALSFGHQWGEWSETKPATCTESGEETRTCTRCGETESRVLEPISCPSKAYTDLDTEKWYHPYTDYVISQEIMVGYQSAFTPNAGTTRAMLVQTMYNLAGQPDAGTDSGFVDVNPQLWYAKAITWARQEGIIQGVDENHFVPERLVTREEAVTILYRYVKDYMGLEMIPGVSLDGFTDAGQVSGYAETAMAWAVATELVNGVGNGRLSPKGTATRCQLAKLLTVLHRDILN